MKSSASVMQPQFVETLRAPLEVYGTAASSARWT